MPKRRLSAALVENLECRRLLTSVLGVDAAGSYQYVLNWATVKADGYIFGWEKATQGTYSTQSLYTSNISSAKAAGVDIGAYCFADFRDDATATANYFWNEIKSTISGDGLTLQPALDAESYNPTGMNLDNWVATWSSVLKADGAAAGVTLNPIIYSDTSFAADYFTTATSKNYPLWIAEPGSTAPTNSHTAPWTSYEAWQYGEKTFPSSGGNVATDVDRLNGDATELKNLIVGEGKFDKNSTVATTGSATAYQNSNNTGTTHTVAANVDGTVLSLPVYYNNNWMFDVQFTTGVTGWVKQASLVGVPTAPPAPTNVSPTNNSTFYSTPTLSWNSAATATSYNVFLNNTEIESGLTTTSYSPGMLDAGSYSWYVQAVNAIGATSGSAWSFSIVLPIPTASYVVQVPTTGASVLDFSVGYADPATSIDTSTFDSNDVVVTGPNGYSQPGIFISQSQPGNGPQRSATYEIAAPGGVWNVLSNGTYTVTLNANQVADTAGAYVVAKTLGTFTVNAPFAYIPRNGTQLVLDATASNPNISLAKSGSLWNISNGSTTIQFNPLGFSSVDFEGTPGDDSLTVYLAMNMPLSFNGSSGNDALYVSGGSLALTSDLGVTTSALTLTLSGTSQVTVSSNEHLAELDVYNGSSLLMTPQAGIAIGTQALVLAGTGYIDVADNALVVEGGDPATINSYLVSGSNNGAWNGPGIRSSTAAVTLGRTLGFAPGSNVSYSSVNGVSFSTAAIVVRYTYGGDANLDNTVNADDLSLLALAAAQQQAAVNNHQTPPTVYWYNGDFNYDSTINSDDFLLLSLGSAVQNQQMLG